jgi:hypothetical protein
LSCSVVEKVGTMPSVDPTGADRSSLYPTSPPGPPPPGRAVDSPDRRGPSSHGPYGYVPAAYGGPPGSVPSAYYPMGPQSTNNEKSGNPFYAQYPPPPHHHPQSYPGYGNAASAAYMTYAYTGGPWMSYEGNGGPPPPPPSSVTGPGYYPSQRLIPKDKVPSPPRSVREGPDTTATQAPYSIHDTTSRHKEEDTGKDTNTMSSTVSDAQRNQQLQNLRQNLTAEELERMKAAAVVELRLSEVKPIQTDFHFFVRDRKEKLLTLATLEVDKKLEGKSPEFIRKHRTFLIHSNLNCRILRAWEDLPRPEREEYFKKEEDDRQRFMEDDEVVSRHCFTLTARIRSPNKTDKPLPYPEGETGGDGGEGNEYKSHTYDRDGDDDEMISDVQQGKRLPDDDATTKEDSPSKKNKADNEASDRKEVER